MGNILVRVAKQMISANCRELYGTNMIMIVILSSEYQQLSKAKQSKG